MNTFGLEFLLVRLSLHDVVMFRYIKSEGLI